MNRVLSRFHLSGLAVAVSLFLPSICLGASGVVDRFNNVSINIPDNTGASANVSVTTDGAPTNAIITSVSIYPEVTHTYRGDLQIWATAFYDGSWHDHFLLNRPLNGTGNDSSDDFIGWINGINTWNGASANQTWHLSAKDLKTGDTGKLEFFQIQVYWASSANISVDVRTSSGARLSASEMNAVILFESDGTEKDRKTNPSSNPVVFPDALFGSYFVDVYCWDMLTKRYNFTHSSTSTSIAPQQDTQKRTLKVTTYYAGGTIPFSGAAVYLDSWNGETNQWTQRASGTTASDGSYSFSAWPTTISGEKYRLRVDNGSGAQVGAKSDATLANTSSGSSYSLTTSQAVPTGTISVDVRNSANAVLAVAEMNAVILFDRRLPDGSNEILRRQPPTANPVQFTGIQYGPTYFADVYCWDMLAGRSANFSHMSPTTTPIVQTNPKRPLTVTVLYTDGISKFPGATVSLDSYNGQFATWQNRASGVADADGNVVFGAWPTTVSGEKYRLRAIWNGNQVGLLDPVTLANAAAGNRYSITTGIKLAEITEFTAPPTGQRARGTQLQTMVQVRNNSTSPRSFWVGLSFAHETATNATWPVGFYDIQPIQTPTIEPGQITTVTFSFAPHKNLRPGQYFARASTWPGFDSTQYLMVQPRLDDTLDNAAHPEWTTSRTEWIGLGSFSLGSYEAPRDTLLGQIEYAIKQDYFKVPTLGDLYRRQPNAQKPLLVVSAGVDGTVFGIPVGASGSVLIDMADLLDLSPEGSEWVTVWVDAEGHVGYNLNLLAPGSPVDISVIPHDFVFAERALADRRLFTVEVVGASVPGFAFTALSCDVTSCDAFRLQWNGSASVSLNLFGASTPLIRTEVSKNILRNIFTNNPTGITGVVALRDYLINAFHGFSGSVRTITLDDGDWPLVSHQRETPLTLTRVWMESERTAHYFYIDVPAKTTDLTIQTTGGAGDADLYVRYASRPTSTNPGGYDFKSATLGNTESVSIPSPEVGRWFIMLPTTSSYDGIELLARVDASGDTTWPAVTVSAPPEQPNPANASPIRFRVTFSEPVTGFTSADVALSGTAGATQATVSGAGAEYAVDVSGMTQSGTVALTVPANVAQDAAGNWNTASPTSAVVTFNLTTPPKPDIDIQANGLSISSGDLTPSPSDGTDFGMMAFDGAAVTHHFTIRNTGTAPLNLNGSPLVALSGANTADFTITPPSMSTVLAGQEITFAVTFDARAAGPRAATISIANSDADENPYTFAIQGSAFIVNQNTVVLDPNPIAFGEVTVGQSRDLVLHVTNHAPIAFIVTGFNPPPGFSTTWQPVPILSGATVGIPVRFTPTEERDYAGFVFITSNFGPASFAASGRGGTVSPEAGLVAHWTFDDENANDVSGGGHHGTAMGGVGFGSGVRGKAANLDGTTGHITVPGFNATPASQRSVCLWVKQDEVRRATQDIISHHSGPADIDCLIRSAADGKYDFLWRISTTNYDGSGGMTIDDGLGLVEPTQGAWDFLALTYDGAAIRFYHNGTLLKSLSATGDIAPSSRNFSLGAYAVDQTNRFRGSLDDVRIYHRALTHEEILVLSDSIKTQTISFAQPADQTYGDAPFAVSASASSGLPVELSVVSGPATLANGILTITGAGEVVVQATQAGDATWAPANPVSRTFTIAKKELTVTAANLTRRYGGATPTPTYTISGFVNSDTAATATTGAPLFHVFPSATDPAGAYPIILHPGSLASPNYRFTPVNGVFTVTKAPLTAYLNGVTRVFGTDNPPFSISYLGFMHGENVQVLDSPPVATTTATSTSPVGTYPITLSGGSDNNYEITLENGTLTITPVVIPDQAPSVTVDAGDKKTLSFTVDAGGANVTYQWQFLADAGGGPASVDHSAAVGGWTDISDATSASYTIPSTQRFHAGSYRVVITANGVSVASEPVIVGIIPVISDSRLINLSTRGLSLTGNDVLIPGFVVQGTGTKRLLIRAVGPTLGKPPFGLSDVLPNPQMILKRWNPATPPNGAYEDFAANDDWSTNANAAAITTTGAEVFAFGLNDDREAALLLDLPAGQYTVVADGVAGGTGIAVVELYDADGETAAARLANISTRGFAGVGDNVMIPGFVVSHEGSTTVLLRVVGPGLTSTFGLAGTMADPKLTVYRRESNNTETLLFANDDWGDNPDAAYTATVADQVFAFPLNADSKDAAFVVTLPPGVYTVVGTSADGVSTGVVLVEVYVVQ